MVVIGIVVRRHFSPDDDTEEEFWKEGKSFRVSVEGREPKDIDHRELWEKLGKGVQQIKIVKIES